jgi:broad specificity phosphatase PhoE
MEIVLIRHGEPEWVRDGLNVVDPPLTERGRRQAECVADALDGEQFDEIRTRLPNLVITSEPDYLQSAFINGIKRMRCAWK